MVKIVFEGRAVHLPGGDVSVSELMNIFQVERPGIHLKLKRGSNAAFENIWPDDNGILKCPQSVETAILIALKEVDQGAEEQLDVVQNTPTFSAFTSGTGLMERYNQHNASSTFGPRARRGNATATMHRYLQGNHQASPASASSTFNNISRSFGARPAPSIWNASSTKGFSGNKRRKVTMENKSFRLTFFDTDCNSMQDMWDIPIDLSRLSLLHGTYSVFDITRALQSQLGEADPDAKVIVTDIKGNPIKDMVTTRGASFWAAQKEFRVFYMKNFAEWKPHVWNSIKADFGFHSDEEEDDDDLVDFSLPSRGLEVLQPSTSTNISVKRSVKGSEAKLDKILEMLNAEEEKKKLTEVFKCLVCRETSSNVMFSCTTGCGRLLGCFKCLFRIENCPLCRKDLPCVTERKPLLIPGIAALLGVPEISLKSALKEAGAIPDENSGDSDLELEESLPLSSSRRVGVERSDQPN